MTETFDKISKTLDEAMEAKECDRPPEGWYCTRGYGHEGPCAAEPVVGVSNPGKTNPFKDDHDV